MPPLVGVAVNNIDTAEHTVGLGVAIITDGVTDEFTVIVIVLELAKIGEAQFTELVILQTIASLFDNVASTYVAVFVPTFNPFFFH